MVEEIMEETIMDWWTGVDTTVGIISSIIITVGI